MSATPRTDAVENFVRETRMRNGETSGYESTLLTMLREHARLLDAAQERIAQLTAPGDQTERIARLRACASLDPNARVCRECGEAATAIEQLQARVRELEPDAERYRWLRSPNSSWWAKHGGHEAVCSQLGSLGDIPARLHSERLDDAIDAARKEPT